MILDFDLLPFFSNEIIIDQNNEKEEEEENMKNDDQELKEQDQEKEDQNNNKDLEPSLNFLVLVTGSEDGKSKIFLSDPLHPTLKIQNIDNDDEMVDDEMVDDEST